MCLVLTLDELKAKCQIVSVTGLTGFFDAIFEEEVTTIPPPDASDGVTVSTMIAVRPAQAAAPASGTTPAKEAYPAGRFRKIHTLKKNTAWKVEALGDAEDPKGYKTTATYRIKRIDPATISALRGVLGAELILICTDNNGYRRLVGEKNNGCNIKITEENGADNYVNVEVVWEQAAHAPYFYTASTPR